MKKTTYLLIPIIAFTIACEKDRIEESEETVNSYNSPDEYLDSKQQQEQEFTIEDEEGTEPIRGNQGTKIYITKDCLETPNGDSIEFPYTVRLMEIYTARDMIYHRMPTMAAGNILETDGQIRVRAFKDETELKLKNGCHFWVEMPEETPKNYMEVYYGIEGEVIDWTNNPGFSGTPTPFANVDSGYQAQIYKLGWINCDFQVGDGTGSQVLFTSTTDDLTNLRIFIFIPAYKTVMMVQDLISDPIPVGTDIEALCIGVDAQNKLFKYYTQHSVSGTDAMNVVMSETSDAELTGILNGL